MLGIIEIFVIHPSLIGQTEVAGGLRKKGTGVEGYHREEERERKTLIADKCHRTEEQEVQTDTDLFLLLLVGREIDLHRGVRIAQTILGIEVVELLNWTVGERTAKQDLLTNEEKHHLGGAKRVTGGGHRPREEGSMRGVHMDRQSSEIREMTGRLMMVGYRIVFSAWLDIKKIGKDLP